MRKNINKLATLVMTGALAASMSFGAFAEGNTTAAADRNLVDGPVVKIAKDVTTDGYTLAPKTGFELEVAVGDKEGEVTLNKGTGTGTETYKGVEKGTADHIKDMVLTAVEFDPNGTALSDTYTAEFQIDLRGVTFDHAGVYSFKVNEHVPAATDDDYYEGVQYDGTAYDMLVFVVNNANNQPEIANVIVSDGTSKISTITNNYGKEGTDIVDTIHEVTISKVITGTAANLEKNDFKFDITVSGATGEQYKAYITGANSDVTEMIFKTGEPQTVTGVKNGTEIKICGLSESDTVTVSEQEAGKDGYTTSYTSTKTSVTAGGSLNKDNDIDTDDAVTFTVSEDEATLVITNAKDYTTPTGVAMDIAPYALMVALASGAAATFLRKKESFED